MVFLVGADWYDANAAYPTSPSPAVLGQPRNPSRSQHENSLQLPQSNN